jgi:hypothetical protein
MTEMSCTRANSLASLEVTVDADVVRVRFVLSAEVAARSGETAPTFEPSPIEFLAGDQGEYAVGAGDFEGTTGAFTRTESGTLDEVAFGGRWYRRPPTAGSPAGRYRAP